MMLETLAHGDSVFITLTYNPENYPVDGSLQPRDTTLFLKRLRERLKPRKLRYFLVGEYGDKTQRAHYHAALFGVSLWDVQAISDSWDKGFVHCGDLTFASSSYICGYVVKKMTKKGAFADGRHEEFARMSRRPGIGADIARRLGEKHNTKAGAVVICRSGDVAGTVRIGGKLFPLGRYLTGVARETAGLGKLVPEEALALRHAEEVVKYEAAPDKVQFFDDRIAERLQKSLQLETREKIYSKGKLL